MSAAMHGAAARLPRDRPLVRRQGPRRSSVGRRAPAAVAGGRRAGTRVGIELVTVDVRRRPASRDSTRCRWPTTTSPQERLDARAASARGRTPSSARSHVYDAVHDRRGDGAVAAGVRRGRRRRRRAPAATWSSTGCPATTSTSRRTPRCSPASRATPRWRSARTPDEGVPQGHPGPQPRHRDPRGADRARAATTSPRSTAGSSSRPGDGADEPVQLAMLQQFLRTASDGWDLALASVRDLFAEADLHADEVGGDFAGEAERLGGRPRRCTTCWPSTSPPRRRTPTQLAALADAMPARLEAALAVVPSSAPHADGAARDRSTASPSSASRRAASSGCTATSTSARRCAPSKGWKIVDFEGEPAKPLAERVRPDSPGATSPACCGRSTTPRTRSRPTSQADDEAQPADRLPGRRVGRAQPARRSCAATSTTAAAPPRADRRRAGPARGVRRRQGRLRGRLRGPQPADLAADPAGRDRPDRPARPSTHPDARRRPTHERRSVTARRPSRPRPGGRRPARQPARRPRRAPARRRRDGPRVPAAGRVGRRGARRRRGPARATSTTASGSACSTSPSVPDYRLEVAYAGSARDHRRRPLPLPADARRGGPAPDQRGPARAAVGRCSARTCTPTTRRTGAGHRHLVRGLGAARQGRAAQGRLQQLGRPRAPDAPARRRPACGSCSCPASAPARSYKFVVLGADGQWREKADPMAFHTEVPPATSSVVFESTTPGATTPGWTAPQGRRRARAADVGLRGAPRLLAARPVLRASSPTSWSPTSRTSASPTSS